MQRETTFVSTRTAVPPVAADVPIAWIGKPPADEEARELWATLTEERVGRYGAAVERVAERLFRRDLATLGAVADIGFFQPFYLAHARSLIAALDGTLVRIGGTA